MSGKNATSEVVSVDEQAFENTDEAAVDEAGFEVVEETLEFQATVQMEVQAKVDANHPDGMVDTSDERIYGATLEQEERIRAREAELERISAQAELGTQDGREKRTRDIAAKRSVERRAEFQKRAASVNPWRTQNERTLVGAHAVGVSSSEQAVEAASREAGRLVASSNQSAAE